MRQILLCCFLTFIVSCSSIDTRSYQPEFYQEIQALESSIQNELGAESVKIEALEVQTRVRNISIIGISIYNPASLNRDKGLLKPVAREICKRLRSQLKTPSSISAYKVNFSFKDSKRPVEIEFSDKEIL